MAAYVFNVTKGCYRRYKDAVKAIQEHCSACWVEEGVSIRDLTPQEAIQARNEQARLREPLPYKEIHGLRYEPSVHGVEASRREGQLVWQAHQFATQAA